MTWPNRILLAALLVGLIAFLPRQDAIEPEDLSRVTAERELLQGKVTTLNSELVQLEAEVRALHRPPDGPRGDDGELARIARGDLNLIRPGEVVFEISPAPSEAKP